MPPPLDHLAKEASMKLRILVVIGFSIVASGCATEKWAQLDDKQCRAWGATGDQYDLCRDALNKKRWREIGEAFDQMGQGASQVARGIQRPDVPAPTINPPCIGCTQVYRGY